MVLDPEVSSKSVKQDGRFDIVYFVRDKYPYWSKTVAMPTGSSPLPYTTTKPDAISSFTSENRHKPDAYTDDSVLSVIVERDGRGAKLPPYIPVDSTSAVIATVVGQS